MQIRNGNLTLHVAEDGDSSAPPILLLHGITSSVDTWEWLVPTLAERFRVLRLDFRGHGRSDRAPEAYTTSGYVSDAVVALEEVAGMPCPVIGHSLGGAIALALTQRHPHLVTAALLEDPPLGFSGGATSGAEVLEGNSLLDGFRLMRQMLPQLQASQIPLDTLVAVLAKAPDTSATSTFGEMLHRDAIETMARALLAVDVTVLDPVLTGSVEPFLDAGASLPVPALIVCADPSKPDAVADPALAEGLAARSPSVEVKVAAAGHLIHDEKSSRDWFRTAVVEFLDRVAPA